MSGLIEGNLPYIPTDYVRHPEFLATTFSREIISDNLICVQRLPGGGSPIQPTLPICATLRAVGKSAGPAEAPVAGTGPAHLAYPVRRASHLTYPAHQARTPHFSPSPRPHIWVTLFTSGLPCSHRAYPTHRARPHIWVTLRTPSPPPDPLPKSHPAHPAYPMHRPRTS